MKLTAQEEETIAALEYPEAHEIRSMPFRVTMLTGPQQVEFDRWMWSYDTLREYDRVLLAMDRSMG